jgi:outer membrane autotransporter protein
MQTTRFMDSLASRLGGIPRGGSFGGDARLDPVQLRAIEAERLEDGTSRSRGMWMRSFGLQGELPGNGNTGAANWRGSGTVVGFDAPVDEHVSFGTSFFYGNNLAQLDEGHGGWARIKSPAVATYASYSGARDTNTGWQLRGLVGYAQPTISSSRYLTVGNATSVANGVHDARELSVGGEAEVSRNTRYFRMQGVLGLRGSRMQEDGFTETGSFANLQVSDRTTQSLTSNVGARLLVPAYREQGLVEIRASWSHQLAAVDSAMTAKLADAMSAKRFAVNGLPADRDSFLLGAGLSGTLKRNLSYYADYSLELGGAVERQHTGMAGLRLTW